jgi:hypothetical protein
MKVNSLLECARLALFRRPDLNNPPTSVGGIQELGTCSYVGWI